MTKDNPKNPSPMTADYLQKSRSMSEGFLAIASNNIQSSFLEDFSYQRKAEAVQKSLTNDKRPSRSTGR
jgi:hypothetical protein